MKRFLSVCLLVALTASARTNSSSVDPGSYFPLNAAPEYHRSLLENEFVLVLDVSIPPGATVPAHLHPWPAVFITLEPAHLLFRNLDGRVLREVRPDLQVAAAPLVEWRAPDTDPVTVTNVSDHAQRAIRVELKFLGP